MITTHTGGINVHLNTETAETLVSALWDAMDLMKIEELRVLPGGARERELKDSRSHLYDLYHSLRRATPT